MAPSQNSTEPGFQMAKAGPAWTPLSPAYAFLAAPWCSRYITGIVLPVTGSLGA